MYISTKIISYALGILIASIGLWFVYHEPARNVFAFMVTVIVICIWELFDTYFLSRPSNR